MRRTFTCIICPNGCEIQAETENGIIREILGYQCGRGEAYVKQELTAPVRNLASTILVEDGMLPLASVRLTAPIPREKIFDAMEEIRKIKVKAPVRIGMVVIKNLLGYDSDVIVTKDVSKL